LGVQQLAAFKKRLEDFEGALTTLVNTPADLLAQLTDIFDGFVTSTGLLDVYAFDPGTRPPATTSNREQEQQNFDAVQRLVQRLVVLKAAELAADETFDSYEAAASARDLIADKIDDQAEIAVDDTYPALLQLRADLVKAVPGDEADLHRLVKYTPAFTMPSLVLAYQLYGNLDLEADLVARNGISNPGFIRGGEELEVLSAS
jgi:prophage DNA circulation protein